MISIPPDASPRSAAMLHRINAALAKPGAVENALAPQIIMEAWTAETLGLAIKQAIASGTDWTSTAESLADRMSLRLSRPDAADDATGGGATDSTTQPEPTPTTER